MQGVKTDQIQLVPHEETPEASTSHPPTASSIPIVYYTTSGGRIAQEVVVDVAKPGLNVVRTPESTDKDRDPKVRIVTDKDVKNVRCFLIITAIFALPLSPLLFWFYLKLARSVKQEDQVSARKWVKRAEKLFVCSMVFVLIELVVILVAVEMHLTLTNPNGRPSRLHFAG